MDRRAIWLTLLEKSSDILSVLLAICPVRLPVRLLARLPARLPVRLPVKLPALHRHSAAVVHDDDKR